jgi:SagB-type dehydrogenase family enzyme
MSPSAYYDEFWRASTYSLYNLAELASLQEEFNGRQKQPSILEYPGAPIALPVQKHHPLRKIENSRESIREFSGDTMTLHEISDILSSFRCIKDLEHRTYPSAGAMYGLEIFCATYDVASYENKLLYYNPDRHAISVIGETPMWSEASSNCNIVTNTTPNCIILFVSFPERLTSKYGERGGRFSLIECGAALQQISMHVAASRTLAGCPIGGLVDSYWLDALGLENDRAQLMLGYACGKRA